MNSSFEAVAEIGELASGQMKRFSLNGKPLLLVHAEYKYFAVDEMCSHEDYSLYFGCVKGSKIKCSLHGSNFDLETGDPLDEPAIDSINTYPVLVENGKIWVSCRD